MIRYSIFVKGRVQGVGFRYFAQSTANSLKLNGYAKNLDNGMVEMEIQGLKANIDQFIDTIQEGNRFITVSELIKHEIPLVERESFFNIIH